MPLIDPIDPRPIHFVGIAGAGMSALAELCARRGATVTGCDQNPGGAEDLTRLGLAVSHGHDAAHVDGHRALVVSSAIPKMHPELERARALGIPVIRRAEALAEATAGGQLIGIAGTHGKSTTTVMTTEALKAGGVDATGVVGARVTAWGGNLSTGNDKVFVVEADEYDRSFLALKPDVAVVTNIEADHLDIYRDLTDITDAFGQYVSGARWIAICADDVHANALATPASAEVVRYGIESRDARLMARDVEWVNGSTKFTVVFDGKVLGPVTLGVPGTHNVLNALAALAVGLGTYGMTVPLMGEGLARFVGAERRFTRVGEAAGVLIVDDYAHHPTEIRATIQAARAAYADRRLVVAFQPHLFSRTRDFAPEFATALGAADVVFLSDIYPAREQPIVRVTSALISDAMALAGKTPSWTGARDAMAEALSHTVRAGDLVLTVGAGDVTHTGPELLALLRAQGTAR
ncbi:MAG: UDP-N-acetylmuramate--L-alanine ligase [Gemmatimonadetes bacterium]|nr:UDP-N-acetylmuramate--L-alanine ligase [Gemmatimonadota bacterium]